MILWIDAQLPPQLAPWLTETFGVTAQAVRDLGLRDAEDEAIFMTAKKANAVVVTKDADFTLLLDRFGPPPQVIWIVCGNTSNAKLREILAKSLPDALALLQAGETLVEIAA